MYRSETASLTAGISHPSGWLSGTEPASRLDRTHGLAPSTVQDWPRARHAAHGLVWGMRVQSKPHGQHCRPDDRARAPYLTPLTYCFPNTGELARPRYTCKRPASTTGYCWLLSAPYYFHFEAAETTSSNYLFQKSSRFHSHRIG